MNLPQPGFRIQGRWALPPALSVVARIGAFLVASLPLLVLGNPEMKGEAHERKSGSAVPVAVQRVKLLLHKNTPELEIVTTGAVTPQISKLDNAMRLLIDLPNTNMSVSEKLVPIKSQDLSALRLERRNTKPPMVHIEVDFKRPLGYTWNSAGNRLLVSFHEISEKDAAVPSEVANGKSPSPVSSPVDTADFSYVLPAERLAPGASITADSETTVLRLKSVGDVYICPQTTVSIVHSKNGPDLMLAFSGGALETHLSLQNSADEVVTPDFRILLRGPGEFHYAIRADSRGNTCVRTLPGNKASAVIYELMGDGKFEVQATDQLVFHDGLLSPQDTAFHSDSRNSADTILPVDCGCPPPSLPRSRATLLASNTPQREVLPSDPSSDPPSRQPDPDSVGASSDPPPHFVTDEVPQMKLPPPESGVQIPDLSQAQRQQPHLSVEASLTFTPNPGELAARHLPASSRPPVSSSTVFPPPNLASQKYPERRKTFLGKIKTFFSGAFK